MEELADQGAAIAPKPESNAAALPIERPFGWRPPPVTSFAEARRLSDLAYAETDPNSPEVLDIERRWGDFDPIFVSRKP